MIKKLVTAILLFCSVPICRADITEVTIDNLHFDIATSVDVKHGIGYARATLKNGTPELSGDVVIPSYIVVDGNTYTVTSIDDEAFYNNRNITSVTIPPTIMYIGINSFALCKNIKNVYIEDLEAWMHIDFWDSPTYHSRNLCLNGEPIEELYIPSTITEIPGHCFGGCDCIKKIHFPSTIKEIGPAAFSQCNGITELTLPINVEYVRSSAFSFCENLKHINLPVETLETASYAYMGCSALESITTSFPWPTYMTLGSDVFMMTPKEDITVYYAEDKQYADEVTWRDQWCEFGNYVAVPKCPTPRITYVEATNQIVVVCDAPKSTVYATVIYDDHKEDLTDSSPVTLNLKGMYTVNAYATAPGYYMSDLVEETITLKNPKNTKTQTAEIVVVDETGEVDPASQSATPLIKLDTKKLTLTLTADTDSEHDLQYTVTSTGGTAKSGPSFTTIELDGHVESEAQLINYLWNGACSSDIAHLSFDWSAFKTHGFPNYITLDDDAHTEYLLSEDIDEVTVYYSRTFPSTGTLALYVPFEIEYDEWSQYGTVAKMTGITEYDDNDDGKIDYAHDEFETLQDGESVEPHTMYLFQANEDQVDQVIEFAGEAVALNAAPEVHTPVTFTTDTRSYTFTGNYVMLDGLYDLDAHALSPNGKFVKALSADQKLNPYRFYLQVCTLDGSASAPFNICANIDRDPDPDDDPSGIQDVTIDDRPNGMTYDLQGRPVIGSHHGIFIENGQIKFNR